MTLYDKIKEINKNLEIVRTPDIFTDIEYTPNFIELDVLYNISKVENNFSDFNKKPNNESKKASLAKNPNFNLSLNKSNSFLACGAINCTNIFHNNCNINKENNTYSSKTNFNPNQRSRNNNFISLGVYKLNNSNKVNYDNGITNKTYGYNTDKIIYYDIFYRRIRLAKDEYIEDFFFNDITDLINYKQILLQEHLKKEKIFAKIAHEFKTPLSSVIGLTSNIKYSEAQLSSYTSSKLEIIENLSNYLSFLVSDIIQFANTNDISDIRLNQAQVDIKEIMNFSFNILNSLLSCNKSKNENIKSEIRLLDNLDSLIVKESDEIRIKQILLNFVSNAVKFTHEGKIILKTKKVKDAEDDSFFLKISIKDTGIGIKKENQNSLFQDFKMIENNQSNKINNSLGSGLGLSICKMLCEKLGFKLDIKSQYMKGSTFSILLPLESEPDFNVYQKDQNNNNNMKYKKNLNNEVNKNKNLDCPISEIIHGNDQDGNYSKRQIGHSHRIRQHLGEHIAEEFNSKNPCLSVSSRKIKLSDIGNSPNLKHKAFSKFYEKENISHDNYSSRSLKRLNNQVITIYVKKNFIINKIK